MFFGPVHSLAQYNSLPRRATTNSALQRNTPVRRSTGIPEHHLDYYVPRSISEFNLSGVGDLALPPSRHYSPTLQNGIEGLSLGLQLGPPQTLICAPPPPPPPQLQILQIKPREKMVTFEDESKGLNASTVGISTTTTHCPHGVPTTPRKSQLSTGSSGGSSGIAGSGGDMFM